MTTQNSAIGDEELRERWQHIVFNILGGSDISYTLNPVETTKQRKLIADQFYPDIQKLIKSRDQQIALAARLDESRVSNQLADNNADSHFGSVKIRNELRKRYTALKQAQNKEK